MEAEPVCVVDVQTELENTALSEGARELRQPMRLEHNFPVLIQTAVSVAARLVRDE
jgi:hypothetical protein